MLLGLVALITLLFLCWIFSELSVFPRLSTVRKNVLANMGLAPRVLTSLHSSKACCMLGPQGSCICSLGRCFSPRSPGQIC